MTAGRRAPTPEPEEVTLRLPRRSVCSGPASGPRGRQARPRGASVRSCVRVQAELDPVSPPLPPPASPHLPAGEERRARLQHAGATALAQHRLPVPALRRHQVARRRRGLHGLYPGPWRRRAGAVSGRLLRTAQARSRRRAFSAGAASRPWRPVRRRGRSPPPRRPAWFCNRCLLGCDRASAQAHLGVGLPLH